MRNVPRAALISTVLLGLAACDNGPSKPSTPASAPVHMACTTPEEAGKKAQDITRKLGEALSAKHITEDEYRSLNLTLGSGFQAWSEHQDLKAYCAALDKVVHDGGLS